MKYIDSIREIIGHTPIIKLNNLGVKKSVNIFAKLEGQNPGGSIKDRAGLYMIKDAEDKGLLKRGYTIVEATAGNTGIGVTMAAINKGYNIIFVVPDKFSIEKQTLMKALGAKVINTPREYGMRGAIEKAGELLSQIPNSMSLNQFDNEANIEAHYETTAPEIYNDLDGNIDYFLAGAGSGGTFTGVARYLKERIPRVTNILVDPEGSTLGGGEEFCYNIEGIGNNFVPKTMDIELIDKVIKISDKEAMRMVKELALKEGLIVGTSSGAAIAAALKLSDAIEYGNIVTILPDRGDRYFSKGVY
ncbi:cystathionine beta-synthase (acetylserine-dependent) [Clostridium collagenovorans DSM 3089]|uniref:O-acetylserine (thiol)-lyase n=1 Tax=Clostridium collagenovorans DSM 3089 TaxID=1121306 RepID=A0A1M5WRI5_9CLOT|nr:cysteine synthase family protein [Clostridium collagenovorans]SHH90177.1 cystathionine beta-synthase (acetylserine-dependent) [Clostridium collagenovorans DSM 3089]